MSRITFRASLFYSMLSLGLLTLVTVFILYLWPHGPRSGQLIFLGLNKSGGNLAHIHHAYHHRLDRCTLARKQEVRRHLRRDHTGKGMSSWTSHRLRFSLQTSQASTWYRITDVWSLKPNRPYFGLLYLEPSVQCSPPVLSSEKICSESPALTTLSQTRTRAWRQRY